MTPQCLEALSIFFKADQIVGRDGLADWYGWNRCALKRRWFRFLSQPLN